MAGKRGVTMREVDEVELLRPVAEAALELHSECLSAKAIVSRLEALVRDLGLADKATFVPVIGAEVLAPSRLPEVLLAEVRGHDGALQGYLRCIPRDAEAGRAVQTLAAHAGVALARVERVQVSEHRQAAIQRVAETLQAVLLPEPPELPHTSIAVRYLPASRDAKVGGDFYDVFALPNGQVLIVVGDVMGKGIEAAAHTSLITQTLRALAFPDADLQGLLDCADEQIRWQRAELTATLWCGLYEPDSGELAFASLGHPPALLLRANGEATRLELEGLPLGMRELLPGRPEIRRRALEPRDLLVLYTDGLVENSRDYLAGQEDLLHAVSSRREEPLQAILDGALDELSSEGGYADDAVMLLLRRR